MNLPRPIFILILTLGLATNNPVTGKESNLPRIVFMYADDLGCANLSCYGTPYAKTPNLDCLAWDSFEAHKVAGRYPGISKATDMKVKSWLLLLPLDYGKLPKEQNWFAEQSGLWGIFIGSHHGNTRNSA